MIARVPRDTAARWKTARQMRRAMKKVDRLFWESGRYEIPGYRFLGCGEINETYVELVRELSLEIERLERGRN